MGAGGIPSNRVKMPFCLAAWAQPWVTKTHAKLLTQRIQDKIVQFYITKLYSA